MTIEEIVKHEGRQPDCSGYVTKYDIECSDGLTIRPGAFDDDNGRKVPMVWMHDHQNMDNVLGHIYLESRNDGVYGYGFFNDSPKGQLGKLYVDHGDISSFSIYANKLKKKARDVVHGMIREVSLVLAGANRGAMIDSPISHSNKDEDDGEGVICMGDDYGGPIYGNDEPLSVEEYLEHYGRKGMKWGKNLFKTEYEAHPREKGEEEPSEKDKKRDTEFLASEAASALNSSLSDWKIARDLMHNAKNQDEVDKYVEQYNRKCEDLVNKLNSYISDMDFSKDELELFLDGLQKKFDSNGYDLDARSMYKNGVAGIRSYVKKINEEKAKEALPNTPGMNAKPINEENLKTTGEKIKEGLQEGLDTLKDLGDKAVSKGSEVADKAEDILDDTIKKIKGLFKHSELTDEEAEDIIKHYIAGDITMDDILEHAETEGGKTVLDVFNDMTDEEKSCVYYFMVKARKAIEDGAIEHSEKEENDTMKHNVFDDAKETKENTLSHADMEKLEADVFKDAKSKGSLKDSFLAHAGDYGIDDIEYLFPDDRKVTNTPTWIKRPDGWVSKVMKGVSHSPFSRIKSIFADITEPDARARGYVKGNRKIEEVFGLLKRSTTPTTVYKKQKLDRDDIIDITDFDVVSWLKTEMRGMLDEELARAFLIGDGRSAASSDKINEQNIRPIYNDDDLFVIRKAIAITSSTTADEKCKQFIRACIKARKDYRGSGNPTLFTTEDMLTDMLLMEDQIGHTLYDSADKLATKLRVKEIVTVPVFENQTRISGAATLELMGIIVNLDDYKVGADKGGSVSMFEDFDIDYNQEKYLIETRCSGALTVPYSAIVIESTASVYLDVEADDPTETRYGKTVSSLQSDIVINDDSISGTLNYVTGYTGYSGDTDLQSGYYIALKFDVPNGATTTIAALNNGGSGTPVDLGEDDYAVGRITTKNAKIVVSTTLAGVTVSKTYSLRLLKFGPKS